MKQLLWTATVIIVLCLFSGCKKVYFTEPDEPITQNPGITLKIQGYTSTSDTLKVPFNTAVILEVAPTGSPAPQIISCHWTIDGFNLVDTTSYIKYVFSGTPPKIGNITVVARDNTGKTYNISKTYQIVWTSDGQAPLVFGPSTVNNDGTISVVLAASKYPLTAYSGQYSWDGNVGDHTWGHPVSIASSDTNYNIINGIPTAVTNGNIGKYILIRLTMAPGNGYQMAIAKGPSWGKFGLPFCNENGVIQFNVASNGAITPGVAPVIANSYPGTVGDTLVRFDLLNEKIIIYVNNGHDYNGMSFISFQDSAGNWLTPILQSSVDGYGKWGKLDLLYSSFPIHNLLIMNYGSNISSPGTYNQNRSLSGFWDQYFSVLKVFVHKVDKSGKQYWVVERAKSQ